MILFYNIKTEDIFSVTLGRVHDKEILKKAWVQPSDLTKKDVGKYIVPYKPLKIKVTEEIKEMRVVNKKTMRVAEVVVGKRIVTKNKELIPNVPFSKEILEIEAGASLSGFKFNHKTKTLYKV